ATPEPYQPSAPVEPANPSEPEVLWDEDLDDALARELLATTEYDDDEPQAAEAYEAPVVPVAEYQAPEADIVSETADAPAPVDASVSLADDYEDLLADFGSDPADFTLDEQLFA